MSGLSSDSVLFADKVLPRHARIGLFDSGLGGLSVLKQLQIFADLNGYDWEFVYVGDTARCPYGDREAREIASFVREIVSWLAFNEVDAIVIACNTSAAVAYESACAFSSVPVLDLISVTAGYVASNATKCGVIATATTVKSKAFSKAIQAIAPSLEVIEIACPELVPIVERAEFDTPSTALVLSRYLDQLRSCKVDTLVLGCTHFPLLSKQIEELIGEEVEVVDPAHLLVNTSAGMIKYFVSEPAITTGDLNSQEHRQNDLSFVKSAAVPSNTSARSHFYVTGDLEIFAKSATQYLGEPISTIEHLPLEVLINVGALKLTEQAIIASEPASEPLVADTSSIVV